LIIFEYLQIIKNNGFWLLTNYNFSEPAKIVILAQ